MDQTCRRHQQNQQETSICERVFGCVCVCPWKVPWSIFSVQPLSQPAIGFYMTTTFHTSLTPIKKRVVVVAENKEDNSDCSQFSISSQEMHFLGVFLFPMCSKCPLARDGPQFFSKFLCSGRRIGFHYLSVGRCQPLLAPTILSMSSLSPPLRSFFSSHHASNSPVKRLDCFEFCFPTHLELKFYFFYLFNFMCMAVLLASMLRMCTQYLWRPERASNPLEVELGWS